MKIFKFFVMLIIFSVLLFTMGCVPSKYLDESSIEEDMPYLENEQFQERYKGGDPINITEESALKIADIIFKEKYPDIDFSLYEIKIDDGINFPYSNENQWVIYCSPIIEQPLEDNMVTVTFGGGGPSLFMDKRTCEISEMGLQK